MPQRFIKDPNAVLDYLFDWSDWLDTDTLTSFTVVINESSPTLVIDSSSLSGTTGVKVWLSGGTVGVTYTLTCHIVTTAGRQDDRTISIEIKQR